MEKSSKKQDFETALLMRNSILDIEKTMEKQHVVFETQKANHDYIAISNSSNIICVSILQIRQGRLINKKDFSFTNLNEENDFEESYESE